MLLVVCLSLCRGRRGWAAHVIRRNWVQSPSETLYNPTTSLDIHDKISCAQRWFLKNLQQHPQHTPHFALGTSTKTVTYLALTTKKMLWHQVTSCFSGFGFQGIQSTQVDIWLILVGPVQLQQTTVWITPVTLRGACTLVTMIKTFWWLIAPGPALINTQLVPGFIAWCQRLTLTLIAARPHKLTDKKRRYSNERRITALCFKDIRD